MLSTSVICNLVLSLMIWSSSDLLGRFTCTDLRSFTVRKPSFIKVIGSWQSLIYYFFKHFNLLHRRRYLNHILLAVYSKCVLISSIGSIASLHYLSVSTTHISSLHLLSSSSAENTVCTIGYVAWVFAVDMISSRRTTIVTNASNLSYTSVVYCLRLRGSCTTLSR